MIKKNMEVGTNFGKDIREKEFTLKDGVTFINQGSFGVVPKRVQDAQIRCIRESFDFPDLSWHNLRSKVDDSKGVVANFIKADKEDVVFVPNVTTAVATVLKALDFSNGDIILCTEYTYLPVKHVCNEVSESLNSQEVKVVHMKLKFPIISEDDIIELYRNYLKEYQQIKVAVIDHITQTTVKMPVDKLVALCKQEGVLSFIDGAHAMGQIPIDLKTLKPDFYSGTLHKWLYSPRGCAILYIDKKYQKLIKPVVVSYGHKQDFQKNFFYQGTRDESPFIVAKDAIEFYNSIGGQAKIREYVEPLLNNAVKYLTQICGTNTLPIPKSMEVPYMRMIRLPSVGVFEGRKDYLHVAPLMVNHMEQHNITPLYTFVDGQIYIRLSGNVFNTEEDYIKLGNLIRGLINPENKTHG